MKWAFNENKKLIYSIESENNDVNEVMKSMEMNGERDSSRKWRVRATMVSEDGEDTRETIEKTRELKSYRLSIDTKLSSYTTMNSQWMTHFFIDQYN